MQICCAKITEWINVLFGSPRNTILYGDTNPPTAMADKFDVAFAKNIVPEMTYKVSSGILSFYSLSNFAKLLLSFHNSALSGE